jgi:hypothetical protein
MARTLVSGISHCSSEEDDIGREDDVRGPDEAGNVSGRLFFLFLCNLLAIIFFAVLFILWIGIRGLIEDTGSDRIESNWSRSDETRRDEMR